MQTMFGIGDLVLIPFTVTEIHVTSDGVIYKMKSAPAVKGDTVDTIYRYEEEFYERGDDE